MEIPLEFGVEMWTDYAASTGSAAVRCDRTAW
jgi:hypothetical protein